MVESLFAAHFDRDSTRALQARAFQIAGTGVYSCFLQIAVQLRDEDFKDAIKRISADSALKHGLNAACDRARGVALTRH